LLLLLSCASCKHQRDNPIPYLLSYSYSYSYSYPSYPQLGAIQP
jgi:hypothetical protein